MSRGASASRSSSGCSGTVRSSATPHSTRVTLPSSSFRSGGSRGRSSATRRRSSYSSCSCSSSASWSSWSGSRCRRCSRSTSYGGRGYSSTWWASWTTSRSGSARSPSRSTTSISEDSCEGAFSRLWWVSSVVLDTVSSRHSSPTGYSRSGERS